MKSNTISTTPTINLSIPFPSVAMSNKTHIGYTLIRASGMSVLAILILVSIAGAAPFAYVTTIGIDTGTVFVIDTATDNLTAVVPVEGWAGEAAINPAGTKVYVTDSSGISTNVFVIDTATNTVDAVVDVGIYPLKVSVNPKGSRVYVTNRYSRMDDNSNNVSVINTVIGTSTNTVMDPINMGLSTNDVAFSLDGKKIYATNTHNNTTSVIDAATKKVTATVPVGGSPTDIAVSPDGTKVYVTNSGSFDNPGNTVSVIDTKINTVKATVPVGKSPHGIAVTPDGKKAYVAIFDSRSSDYKDNVSIIDTATNKVTATVNTGKYTMNGPVRVIIGPFKGSNRNEKSTGTTTSAPDQSTMATLNATENMEFEETNLSSSEEKNAIELNNSNNINPGSDNGSNSDENESSKNNSAPSFRLLGSLACVYGGWKLWKK